MSFREYIYEHTWRALPKVSEVRESQRLWAAVLWGEVLLGGIAVYTAIRHHGGDLLASTPRNLLIAAALLQVLLLIPPLGGHIYIWVLRVFAIIGFFISQIMLSGLFYLMFTPVGWFMRKVIKRDPLQQGQASKPSWQPHKSTEDRRRYYRMS